MQIFLKIQRPDELLKNCWSITLEGMDGVGMENFERLRAQFLEEKVLKTSERISRIHVRDDGPSLKGVQTEFVMRRTSLGQTEWKAMIEGLKKIFVESPSALRSVKLQAAHSKSLDSFLIDLWTLLSNERLRIGTMLGKLLVKCLGSDVDTFSEITASVLACLARFGRPGPVVARQAHLFLRL